MRVLIVTGHPAQIHNFRLLREELISAGHEVYWLASEKDISKYLLDYYKIDYEVLARPSRGNGSRISTISKISTLIKNTLVAIRLIKRKKIDFIVSRTNPSVVLGGYLCGVPQIGLSDTEAAGIYNTIFSKFLGASLTGVSFEKELNKTHIRYKGNIELCYLHPKRFVAEEDGCSIVGVEKEQPYVIVRFVAWEAFHDKGHEGISTENKLKLITELSKYARVFISSENELPQEFESYRIKIPFEKMHAVLKDAELFYGEGASMASECAVIGTPAVYVNDLWNGYTNEEERAGLLWSFKTDDVSQQKSIGCAVKLLKNPSLKEEMEIKLIKFLNDKIDVTAFLLWFIENYPNSKEIMMTNPEYQNRFKQ